MDGRVIQRVISLIMKTALYLLRTETSDYLFIAMCACARACARACVCACARIISRETSSDLQIRINMQLFCELMR